MPKRPAPSGHVSKPPPTKKPRASAPRAGANQLGSKPNFPPPRYRPSPLPSTSLFHHRRHAVKDQQSKNGKAKSGMKKVNAVPGLSDRVGITNATRQMSKVGKDSITYSFSFRDQPRNSWLDILAEKSLANFKSALQNRMRLQLSVVGLKTSTVEKPFQLAKVIFDKGLSEIISEDFINLLKKKTHDALVHSLLEAREKKIWEFRARCNIEDVLKHFDREVSLKLSERWPEETKPSFLEQNLSYAYKECLADRTRVRLVLEEQLKEASIAHMKEEEKVANTSSFSLKEIKVTNLDHLESPKASRVLGRSGQTKGCRSDERIVNLSQIDLPIKISSILNKGYKYILHHQLDRNQITVKFDEAVQLIKAKKPELNKDFDFSYEHSKLRIKALNQFYGEHIEFIKEKHVIKEFLTANDLIVKAADKNLGLVVMDKLRYEHEVAKHLLDTFTYSEVDTVYANKALQRLVPMIKNHTNGPRWLMEQKVDIARIYQTPEFYILPKIHKTPFATRPIVPNCNSATTNISKWLDEQLKPLLVHYPWVSTGTLHTILEIEKIQVLFDEPLVCSGDIVSLYTNIDNRKGLGLLKKALQRGKIDDKKSNLILNVMLWLLNNSFFKFRERTFRQLRGVPMGTNVAPTYANIVLGEIESNYEDTFKEPLPLGYTRFIDDTFMVLNRPNKAKTARNLTELFKNELGLEWTWEIGNEIPFLDLKISLGKTYKRHFQLDYTLYEKPTNNHQYTDTSSNYPDKYKFGWIYGENVRILRNCKDEREFNIQIEEFKKNLKRNQYPQAVIDRYCNLSYDKRPQLLNQTSYLSKDKKWKHFIGITHENGGMEVTDLVKTLLQRTSNMQDFNVILRKGQSILDTVNKVNKELFGSDE